MKKFLLSLTGFICGLLSIAQSPTTVSASSGCIIFKNFNSSDENFSSPSIYSDANDVSFFWNSGIGAEVENSGLALRQGSLISPAYVQTDPGVIKVGFAYSAPVNTEYRIRVIKANGPLEIVATTANGAVYSPLPSTSGNVCLLLTDNDLVTGDAIRLEFTFRASFPGNVVFDDLSLSVAGGPLPVTFEGFTYKRNSNNSLKLLWDVGTELNVKGYYIEMSTDGRNFSSAGYVPAAAKDIYSFNYLDKLSQTSYFRIKSVDFDGSFKYTPIIKVDAKEVKTPGITVYPNPVADRITVQHNKAGDNSIISLLSPEGRVFMTKVATPATYQTQMDIQNLSKGLYFVRYDDGEGNTTTSRIIKN